MACAAHQTLRMDGLALQDLAPRIRSLIAKLDATGSFEQLEIANELNILAGDDLPRFLSETFNYKATPRWELREAMILLCGPYAPHSEEAVQLGLRAARDRSSQVRFRALEMLAYSQKPGVLAQLEGIEPNIPAESQAHLEAAKNALLFANPALFRDRIHRRRITFSAA